MKVLLRWFSQVASQWKLVQGFALLLIAEGFSDIGIPPWQNPATSPCGEENQVSDCNIGRMGKLNR